MPLSGIRILLSYSGATFEAYTSRAGVINGWCHRAFTKPRANNINHGGWLHCRLTFSSVARGTVHAEYWLHEEDQHLFILHWGLDDHKLEHFPTPLDSPWVVACERLAGTIPADPATPALHQQAAPSTSLFFPTLPSLEPISFQFSNGLLPV